jgi:hypothetical protein
VTEDLLTALEPVIEVFDSLGVRYSIGGSVASSIRGVPRSTLDIDIVADLVPSHARALGTALAGSYYADEDHIRNAILRQGCFNLIHLATAMKIDVFVLTGDRLACETFARRSPVTLGTAGTCRTFWVASAESMVVQKLRWYRSGGEVSERQWRDVVGILKVQEGALDREFMDRMAREGGLSDLLSRAWRDASEPV